MRAIRLLCLFLLASLSVVPAASQRGAPPLAALKTIERGLWELREKDHAAPPLKICVRDPMMLMQIGHGAAACSRFVVDNGATQGTVYYTCPGAGHGQTTVRVEGARLFQLDSQGFADQAPFNHSYEGRHVGACNGEPH